MAHGESDEILTLDVAERSRKALGAIGAEIEWHQYPMAHNLCTQEVADLRQWLIRRLTS
jgi:phospholipase/carboxylesterase